MTDLEYSTIMKMEKHFKNCTIDLPKAGEKRKVDVLSRTTNDCFVIDIDRRSSITLNRQKIQERHINTQERLIRLEIDGRPHTNPDGTLLSGNHIHIYKEGHGLSYAFELSDFENGLFANIISFYDLFCSFCKYCNIGLQGITIQDVI